MKEAHFMNFLLERTAVVTAGIVKRDVKAMSCLWESVSGKPCLVRS
jgi:hypothetical protein